MTLECVGLTILLPTCADGLESWGSSTSWNPQTSPDPYRNCFTFTFFSASFDDFVKKLVSHEE